jgi:hypothetical protein
MRKAFPNTFEKLAPSAAIEPINGLVRLGSRFENFRIIGY